VTGPLPRRRWWQELGEVCYPQAKQLLITAGCEGSKWNRIEHRLFAFITQNWER
jgi:hypothetical protein